MAKAIVVLGGAARLSAPTQSSIYWRIQWRDPVTGKRRETHQGRTYEDALLAASAIVADNGVDASRPPTLQECLDRYIEDNQHKWNPRTVQQYRALGKKFASKLGGKPVTEVTPSMLRMATDVTHLSQGQRLRLRAVVRGTFKEAEEWLDTDGEVYAQAIKIGGTKGDMDRSPEVKRGDVPSSKLVAAFINCAYGTLQVSPLDPASTTIDPVTGIKKYHETKYSFQALGDASPLDNNIIGGLPLNIVQRHAMRKIPKHYTHREQRLRDEVDRVAGMYRRTALVTALGAGGGLRIGEVLALRPRHLLTLPQSWALLVGADNKGIGYSGTVDVIEQASTATGGTIYITHPKGNRERTVHLPAFLPCWDGFGIHTYREQIAQVVPRFADPQASLWEATDKEVGMLWRAGFVPLGWILLQRLRELVQEVPDHDRMSLGELHKTYRNMLLFPTAGEARKQVPGHVIKKEKAFQYDITIVPGTGGYQVETAYANKYSNPVYDYVAGIFNEWPAHRANATSRRGWTHHGLRHYACSSRIISGVPIPIVSRELGHKDAAFTLQRYGHFMPEAIPEQGFEY